MLDAMRRGAVNWLAKILLGLLIIAFAVWGVADVFRNYGRGTLARIGNTEISLEDYRQAYQDELAAISRRLGRRLTSEQAKLLGVEQRALSRLVGAAAIDAHVRQLHLALSDKGMADLIRQDPAFKGAGGTFDQQTFQGFLRQNGVSEAYYISTRRKEEVREQLTDTLLDGLTPPRTMVDLIYRYNEAKRVIEYFTPDYDKLIKAPDPDEAKLKEYYEQNKRQFVTPELRKVGVLLLTRDDVKSRVTVTEDEIKAIYERDKERFDIPEKRHIVQLAFPDMAAAEKAYADLASAKEFNEAAAKLGFKESDIDLGLLARKDLIDPKIAEAAFTLKKDELSKPVQGQFAVVLLRVSEIVPGKHRTYEDVKGEIKDRLVEERANHELQALRDKVENERSAGKTLQETAETLKLPFREIAAIDRNGKDGESKPAFEHAEVARIAQAAFAGTAGIEADATDLSDGGYAWVDVLAVTPEKQKPFEAVQAEVKAGAIEQERRSEIATAATKLVERITAGESFATLANEVGGKVAATTPITRNTTPEGLPQNAVHLAFALPKGGAASALTTDGKARIILRVADVIAAPPPTQEQTDRLQAELARQMQTDVLAEYVAGLQSRYGVSINEAAVKQAMGVDREPSDTE
jgi:peptidyl-prolyl cis-trans isomerase D